MTRFPDKKRTVTETYVISRNPPLHTHTETVAASANERVKKRRDEEVILGVGILFEEWERKTLDASRG